MKWWPNDGFDRGISHTLLKNITPRSLCCLRFQEFSPILPSCPSFSECFLKKTRSNHWHGISKTRWTPHIVMFKQNESVCFILFSSWYCFPFFVISVSFFSTHHTPNNFILEHDLGSVLPFCFVFFVDNLIFSNQTWVVSGQLLYIHCVLIRLPCIFVYQTHEVFHVPDFFLG